MHCNYIYFIYINRCFDDILKEKAITVAYIINLISGH